MRKFICFFLHDENQIKSIIQGAKNGTLRYVDDPKSSDPQIIEANQLVKFIQNGLN